MSFDWTKYTGNLKWLKDRTIFLCRHGSMAYGTNGPDSDEDVKGVFMAPSEYTLGFLNKIQQVDKDFEGVDACLYDIKRFFELTVDANPNMIEVPFVDEKDWLHSSSPWEEIVEHRECLLSQNAKHRFSGYAISQLKRIETHRRWLLHPPTHKPERAEYRLPDNAAIPVSQRDALEAMMKKIIEEWQVDYAVLDDATRIDLLNKQAAALADMKLAADDQYVAAGNKLGLDANAMEYLKAERAYRCALAEWHQYQTWKKERNPARAELEVRFGYDTKHGMHLVRLMRMAREILEGKGVIVRRPDAEELKAIRFNGAWSYDKLIGWAKDQDGELTKLMEESKLPKQPDRAVIDDLCQKLVSHYLNSYRIPGWAY
jgi:predicted nucleotidyltransferase